MSVAIFSLAVVLPIVLWFVYIRWEDKSEPEPGKLLRRCVYLTIGGLFITATLEGIVFGFFDLPMNFSLLAENPTVSPLSIALIVFLAGPIEELVKFFILRYGVYYSHDFNQVFDGIIYGITVALTFSLVENIFYFFQLQETLSTPSLIFTVLFRGIFTTLLHVTATGIVGYYLGKAKFSKTGRTWIISKGVILASLLHGVYNLLVSNIFGEGTFFAVILLITAFTFLVRMWNKPDVRMVWKYTEHTTP